MDSKVNIRTERKMSSWLRIPDENSEIDCSSMTLSANKISSLKALAHHFEIPPESNDLTQILYLLDT